MESIISQVTVLLIVAIVAWFFMKSMGIGSGVKSQAVPAGAAGTVAPRREFRSTLNETDEGVTGIFQSRGRGMDEEDEYSGGNSSTQIMVSDMIRHLDTDGNVLETYKFKNIPEAGLVIGRDPECDFVVRKNLNYISRAHALIGKDDKGLFIKDNGSANGMYDAKDTSKAVKILDLTNNSEFYLANERFVYLSIDPFGKKNLVVDSPTKIAESKNARKVSLTRD